MRILICNYEYPPLGGGGGVVTALLAQEFARRHEVTVLTSQALDLPRESVEDGVRVLRVPVFFRKQKAAANVPSMLAYIPMGIRAGKRLMRSESFDIVNTHFVLPSGPVGRSLSRFGGVPNVLSVHGGDLYDPSKFTSPHRHAILRAWIKGLLQSADRVVAQSGNTLSNVHSYYMSDARAEVIPLGINRPREVSSSRRDYGFQDDQVLLVSIGRLVARKATMQLITLMDRLKDKNVQLIIIGSGPEESMLKAEVESRGLGGRVRFMGYVEEAEKCRLLKISDMYVSTSQHEGFGLVFLEGMAFGMPVVCYDHGGQTDFLENGKTGYVLPLNDLEAFERCCRILIENQSARSDMGQENLRRVQDLFIDSCASRYETIFEELARGYKEKPLAGFTSTI